MGLSRIAAVVVGMLFLRVPGKRDSPDHGIFSKALFSVRQQGFSPAGVSKTL